LLFGFSLLYPNPKILSPLLFRLRREGVLPPKPKPVKGKKRSAGEVGGSSRPLLLEAAPKEVSINKGMEAAKRTAELQRAGAEGFKRPPPPSSSKSSSSSSGSEHEESPSSSEEEEEEEENKNSESSSSDGNGKDKSSSSSSSSSDEEDEDEGEDEDEDNIQRGGELERKRERARLESAIVQGCCAAASIPSAAEKTKRADSE
jgi:hypothetical protein